MEEKITISLEEGSVYIFTVEELLDLPPFSDFNIDLLIIHREASAFAGTSDGTESLKLIYYVPGGAAT